MGEDREEQPEAFLSRWSRRKTEAREPPSQDQAPALPEKRLDADVDGVAPELTPIEKLTLDSDYSGFFHPKVDEDLRRAALRKLFSDPHFNVMDGLDVYIDDYSKSDPIPPEMLAGMKQAQRILDWAKGKEDEVAGPDEADPGAKEQTGGDADVEPAALEAPSSEAPPGAGEQADSVSRAKT